MLQRLALAPPPDEIPEPLDLDGRQRALKVQIQLHPRQPKHVRQQQLSL